MGAASASDVKEVGTALVTGATIAADGGRTAV